MNVVFELSGRRVEDAHVIKLIDKHWHLAAGSLTASPKMLPMKQVLSKVAKGPAPGAPIAMQLLTLGPQTGSGLVTDSDVRITVYVVIECVITDRCVKGASRVEKHGVIAYRIILVAGTIQERVAPMRVVEGSARHY